MFHGYMHQNAYPNAGGQASWLIQMMKAENYPDVRDVRGNQGLAMPEEAMAEAIGAVMSNVGQYSAQVAGGNPPPLLPMQLIDYRSLKNIAVPGHQEGYPNPQAFYAYRNTPMKNAPNTRAVNTPISPNLFYAALWVLDNGSKDPAGNTNNAAVRAQKLQQWYMNNWQGDKWTTRLKTR
jgi:hypothetical protein